MKLNQLHGTQYFCEDDSQSVRHEIFHLLWNHKVHYCVSTEHFLEPDKSNSHFIHLKPILILPSNLHLGLVSGNFPFRYVIKTQHIFCIPHIGKGRNARTCLPGERKGKRPTARFRHTHKNIKIKYVLKKQILEAQTAMDKI